MQVAQYKAVEVGQCLAARGVAGKSTWLAFYGDSSMRQKMEVLINFLPPELVYSYYLNDTKVKIYHALIVLFLSGGILLIYGG